MRSSIVLDEAAGLTVQNSGETPVTTDATLVAIAAGVPTITLMLTGTLIEHGVALAGAGGTFKPTVVDGVFTGGTWAGD